MMQSRQVNNPSKMKTPHDIMYERNIANNICSHNMGNELVCL